MSGYENCTSDVVTGLQSPGITEVCIEVGLHWSISIGFLKVLALESVCIGPYVGETHG